MKEPELRQAAPTGAAAECVELSTGAIPNIFAGHFTPTGRPLQAASPRRRPANSGLASVPARQYNGVQEQLA